MRDYAQKAQFYADSVSAIGPRSVYATAAEYYAGEANKLLNLSRDAIERLNDFKAGTQQLLNNPLLSDLARIVGPLVDAIQLGASVLTEGVGTDKTAEVATGIVAAEVLGAVGAVAGGVIAGYIGAPVVAGAAVGAAALAFVGSLFGEDIYKHLVKPLADAVPPGWWDTYFKLGGTIADAVPAAFWDQLYSTRDGIFGSVNRLVDDALNWVSPRRDPLVLDLDGGGIATSAINVNAPILFDQDGSGVRVATGWIAAGEAIVVRDLNGNGTIDSGLELFGDSTLLSQGPQSGQLAENGFVALANLDADADGVADGKFDSSDVAFGSVRLWRDSNQDGISQSPELFTFAELGVQSIGVVGTAVSLDLGGGNTQTLSGNFVRTTGQVATSGIAELAGSLLLATDAFYREFADDPPPIVDAEMLPGMLGSGSVRDLRAAMSLGTMQAAALLEAVTEFADGTTRELQFASVDALIQNWGATSSMQTSILTNLALADISAGADSPTAIEVFSASQQSLYSQITTLERFNGTRMLEHWVRAGGAGSAVTISSAQEVLIHQAYEELRQSVYSALVLQTRLRPYLDAVELTTNESGVSFDVTELLAIVQSKGIVDFHAALSDLVDLHVYGGEFNAAIGWQSEEALARMLDGINLTPEMHGLLASISGACYGTSSSDTLSLGTDVSAAYGLSGNDIIADSSGNDTLDGGDGDDIITDSNAGTNVLRGGTGNDTITFSRDANSTIDGGAGDDLLKVNINLDGTSWCTNTISGGAGNDRIEGGGSTDTYVFNRGDGQDVISDYGYNYNMNYVGADKIAFGAGITQGDLSGLRLANGSLVLKIADSANPGSTDQITIESWYTDARYQIEGVVFADGTGMTAVQLTTLCNVTYGTAGADTMSGGSDGGTMDGLGGNDTIGDSGGSDTIDGGNGDDTITDSNAGTNVLRGGMGNDTVIFSCSASNTIEGGAGDDLLKVSINIDGASWCINMVTGGAGNDRIESGGSTDTYVFHRGDGQDVINDYGYNYNMNYVGADKILFGAGIVQSDLSGLRLGNGSLVLKIADPVNPGSVDQITIENWYNDGRYQVESAVFADGTSMTKAQLATLCNVTNGTAGADTMSGGSDDGSMYGLGGNDTISDSGGNDTIDGGDGDDTITDSNTGTNVLRGGTGNDTVTFSCSASNAIEGGAGDDLLKVNTNAGGSQSCLNTITGGAGNDRIESGGSTDSYVFNHGDGQDVISDYGYNYNMNYVGADKIVFGAGITQNDLSGLRLSNGSLVVKIADATNPGASDQITVEGWHADARYQIESVVFADGTSMTQAQLATLCNVTYGTAGADTMSGGSDDGAMYGLEGNDTLTDGAGSDTLDGGSGDDVITDSGAAGTNVLRGGMGNDTVTFNCYATNTIEGGAGDDLLKVNTNAAGSLSYLNTFTGGAGNDRMQSGGSTDAYVFNRGDGQDVINDYGYNYNMNYVGADKIAFGAGITQSDLSGLRLTNGSLVLKIADPVNPGSTDQITVESWYTDARYQIESVVFADGTSMTAAQLATLCNVTYGTAGTDTMSGGSDDGSMYGLGGNDTISDSGGTDTIDGGDGDDTITDSNTGTNMLRGGTGNDTITFSCYASNTVEGGTGDDLLKVNTNLGGSLSCLNTFTGGAGNDRMQSGGSADTYVFNRGDGQDVINDYGYNSNMNYVGADKMVLGAGITAADLSGIRLASGSLVLKIADPANANASDQITIENWYADGRYQIESVVFANGTSLTGSQLHALGNNFYGTNGTDTISTGNDNGAIYGLGGNDTISDSSGSDTIDGGDGNDTITDSGNGTNLLKGGAGNDTITFASVANNTIEGGTGDDLIKMDYPTSMADAYANTLTGGAGNDVLQSGNSADTYIFNRGDGSDTINDYDAQNKAKIDKIIFGAGIAANDLSMSRVGTSLVVKVVDPANAGANDQITVEAWFATATYQLELFNFADGTSLTAAQVSILGNVLYGTSGADTLSGSNATGAIYGFGGNDTITDAGGSDTIDGGDGNDTITDSGNGTNLLKGGSGNDAITFCSVANSTVEGGAGDDLIKMDYPTSMADAYSNTLTGGVGNDILQSGNSADTYIFNRGDGSDTINDYDAQNKAKTDKIIFGAGITSNDLDLSRVGTGLVIRVIDPANAGANDQITVEAWFAAATYQVELFSFADGSSFTNAAVAQKLTSLYGTSGNDNLAGNANNNLIDGGAGADTMAGAAGDDTYYVDNTGDIVTEAAGQGSDLVYSSITYTLGNNVEKLSLTGTAAINATGNALDNVLAGNSGNNSLTGGAGNDTLTGGVGADLLAGGSGNDTYSFGRNDGSDTLTENDGASGNSDVLAFTAEIAIDQIWFRHVGNDLEVSVIGTADKVTIQNWYLGVAYHVEQFKTADNKLLTDANVENLVQLMGSYTPPASGQTSLPQDYMNALWSTISSNWQ